MKWRLGIAAVAVVFGSLMARAQFQFQGAGVGSPGGSGTVLQFNTNGMFGGITGVTSDNAGNVGFATSSSLFLYGVAVGNCLKVGANKQIADSGGACGGSGSPGGLNSQVQFNTNGTFGGISGATSNASNISFTTNSLVINGQAISKVSGTTGTLATVTGSLSTNCIKADGSGNLVDSGGACGGTSATNIAAGTNITTSGTTSNVTVNVVATPSFSTIIASGNLTAGSGQFTGAVSGTTAVFQTITDALLGGCLQALTGVIGSTGVNCATQTSTPSIAAGTNITTSGTAANTTINVVATPSFTTVIASGNLTAATAQFSGFMSAGGASISGLNIATATHSGNLTGTTANFSGNLTAGSAQFAGFLTVGGASISGLNVATATHSGNLTGTTANFSSNLTANIAQFPGFLSAGGASLSGLTIATETLSGNLTGTTAKFSGNLTGTTAQFAGALTGTSATFQTITDAGFTATQQCVQATNGVLAGTGSPCASPAATSIAAGTNISTTGTASNITVSVSPAGSTTQLQYNNASALGAITGVTSTGTTANFSTNSLVINGQAISKVSGNTGTLATVTGALAQNCLQSDATGNIIDSGLPCQTNAGGLNTEIQFNNLSTFAGVVGATSDGSSIFFATNSLVLQGLTIRPSGTTGTLGSVTGTLVSGNCVKSDANQNLVDAGTTCGGTSATNIAAGTNITTSGTTSNVTVNVVATPSFTTVIATNNLTAATAQFSGFLTAGGASLSGLTIATETLSGALNGATANFSGNLTGTTAQFSGLVTGTTATFQTYTGATLNLSSNLTGTTAQFSGRVTGTTAVFQTVTAQNFTTVSQGFAPASTPGGTTFLRGDGVWSTPTTIGLAASTTTTPLGWVNVNGQGRTIADSVGFITTGFVNLITLNGLVAGRTYAINANLPLKSATASTGGIALRIGGGATATAIVYNGWIVDSAFNGIKGNTQATALSTSVANSSITGTTSYAQVFGTITVNAAGSIVLQASGFSTVTAASAVTVGRGATFTAQDIP